MVRFSDMLGGSGDAEESRASTEMRDLPGPAEDAPDPDAGPAGDAAQFVDAADVSPAPVPANEAQPPVAAGSQSAQEVLDRLTQYASSARAAEQVAPPAPAPPEPAPAPPDPPPAPVAASEPEPAPREEPAGDDILPRARRILRRPKK